MIGRTHTKENTMKFDVSLTGSVRNSMVFLNWRQTVNSIVSPSGSRKTLS